MSNLDFKAFADATTPDQVADRVASGQWSEGQSLDLARRELEAFLSQGTRTADHYLFNKLNNPGTVVGALWLSRHEQAGNFIAYGYDM